MNAAPTPQFAVNRDAKLAAFLRKNKPAYQAGSEPLRHYPCFAVNKRTGREDRNRGSLRPFKRAVKMALLRHPDWTLDRILTAAKARQRGGSPSIS